MDKSNKLLYFAMLSLVFVIFYYMTGSEDAVGNTMQSIVLVGVATLMTWQITREMKKRGKLSVG